MTSAQRFLFGGIGALMPVIVAVANFDLGQSFTTGNIAGIVIRYSALFFLGGFIAYLHTDEQKSFKLIEIGIAAPAMLTSLVAANAIPGNQPNKPPATKPIAFNLFVSPAYAEELKPSISTGRILLAGGFLSDLRDGITGKVYTNATNTQTPDLPRQQVLLENAWMPATAGNVPPGAFVAGTEAPPKGGNTYICRAQFHDGLHPGKLRPDFKGCNIGWGGVEYSVQNYQVLIGKDFKWVLASSGKIADDAVHGGEEHPPGKEELFICRANYKNGVHPGKIRPAFRGCAIGFGGKELTISQYEILVK
jgi:hypothetical protein